MERLSDERLQCMKRQTWRPLYERRMIDELLELRAKLAEWPWRLDAGLSWSGFGISGGERSIAEVRRLISVEARADDLQKEVIELRSKLAALLKEQSR